MNTIVGKQSICFQRPPQIVSAASVVGKKESEGPLGTLFDQVEPDPKVGQATWEEAESALQKRAAQLAMQKAAELPGPGVPPVRYLFSGDLLGQLIATSFGVMDLKLPMFGLYGACSTIGEALMLGAMTVQGGYSEAVLALTSSHFGSAEKQFRFPLEYANQRPISATWTVTGAGAFIVAAANQVTQNRQDKDSGKRVDLFPDRSPYTHQKGAPMARIAAVTTGKIVDYGVKDAMNMGAVMAPAAAALIAQNLEDFDRKPEDYDRIVTGDLGEVGHEILIDLLKQKGFDISKVHADCGMIIYDNKKQGTGSGGSGCGCAATTLSAHFLPRLASGELKRILFVPTGALMSPVSFNEGQSIPGIAHGIVLEHI